jgi:hypothetical protein
VESKKATPENAVTKTADSQSHHSRRAICLSSESVFCARKMPNPSRGEGLVWLARLPKMDSMFPVERPLPDNIRPLLQKKATAKWYRSLHGKNLTERPESGLPGNNLHFASGRRRISIVGPMLQPGQLVRVNLAGLQAEGVMFQAAVTDAVAHIVKQTSEQPPKYLVKLLFSFRGVTEVEVPADRIHADK